MLWSKKIAYKEYPFELESDFENAVFECKEELFGKNRIYFDIKKKIGSKGKTNNIPDGYLLDLSDSTEPRLFVVENELATHHNIKHISIQILEFSLSYESSKVKVKKIIRDEIFANPDILKFVQDFAKKNNYDNVDYVLESAISKDDSFSVLLIIDELNEELEIILESKLNFPITVKTLRRFINKSKDVIYEFVPFDEDELLSEDAVRSVEVDTIVVPAREEGFNDVFIGEDSWYSLRINNKMIPKLKHIAAYQVSPISAITHVAEIDSIRKYENTNKYIIYFKEPARKIEPIGLGKRKGTAPQSPRYCNMDTLTDAQTLDDLF